MIVKQKIKLTKIVLINWMYFQKATLPLEGNAAIVGVNGSGKSTIIDAIQMLLLGQKASKFNANANAEKRTLESYVRGAIATENKEFLRPGDVVSYIALEISIGDTKHIFGINIEYKYNLTKLSDPRYFYIKNVNLSDSLFINENNYPKEYSNFAKEVKDKYDYTYFPTLYNYQIKIKDILGLKNETKYFKILSRAVGIKNINDCDSFMSEFVLDDNIIDISSMKNIYLTIQNLNKKIEASQIKLADLNEIINLGMEIEKENQNIKEYYLQLNLAKVICKENEINNLEKENQNINNKIELELKRKKILENKVDELNSTKNDLYKSLDLISPDLTKKRLELEEKNKEFREVCTNLNTFIANCKQQLPFLKDLNEINQNFKFFIDYIEKENFTTLTATENFKKFRIQANDISDDYKIKIAHLSREKKIYLDKLNELEDEINKLKNNKATYNKNLIDFIDYLKKGLKDKFKEDVEVRFLCEYLDITDDKWRNAIEGYLGSQKFYIIVNPKYYNEALKLYQLKKDFYQTKIINGIKIPHQNPTPNTLGEYIVATNSIALNYARYILNRVYCAKNIYDLENYDNSITTDCIHYHNYSVGRINPIWYKNQYIGQNGLNNQLTYKKGLYQEMKAKSDILIAESNTNENRYENLKNNINFATNIIENNDYLKSIDLHTMLFDEISRIEEDIKFYESDPNYIQTYDKINRLGKDIDKNKNEISKIEEFRIDKIADIKKNLASIDNCNKILGELSIQLNEYDELLRDTIKSDLLNINLSTSWFNNLNSKLNQEERKVVKDKANIENLMKAARDNYSINVEPKYESLQKIRLEASKIVTIVFDYKKEFEDLNHKYKQMFFNDFLNNLYESIKKAQEEINNLNYSLSIFDFGNDFYKIKMSITSNQDLQTIYNYAKKYNSNDADRGIFIDYDLYDKETERIQTILNDYVFSNNIDLQNKIVDYRNYLYFDVEVHTPNGVKNLNTVMKSQSGGEVQVPFYILSGVAFQQTLDYKRRNGESLGIVLYDEAFDKMDSQRVQSMLSYYREKLNLQLILATPGKLDSLVDNVETIIAVIRDGENATVSDVTHEI